MCALSRNGRLLALIQFEKNKAFIVEEPFTYYILVGVHNLPFPLKAHTSIIQTSESHWHLQIIKDSRILIFCVLLPFNRYRVLLNFCNRFELCDFQIIESMLTGTT